MRSSAKEAPDRPVDDQCQESSAEHRYRHADENANENDTFWLDALQVVQKTKPQLIEATVNQEVANKN